MLHSCVLRRSGEIPRQFASGLRKFHRSAPSFSVSGHNRDGGGLVELTSDKDYEAFVTSEPKAVSFIRFCWCWCVAYDIPMVLLKEDLS